jgi:hypothetical protein
VKVLHLALIVVGGVILAGLVTHPEGTRVFFDGINTLWSIGVRPTDTSAIKTSTSVANVESQNQKPFTR